MMQLHLVTFNSRWSAKLVVRLMWRVFYNEIDICLVQELRAIMQRRLHNHEVFPEAFRYKKYPAVRCKVKGELVVFFGNHLTFITTIPVDTKDIQVVILQDFAGRYIGIVNCHFPDQKTNIDYFVKFLYPTLVYGLSCLAYGTSSAWGRPVRKVDVIILGGDLNQAFPGYVALDDLETLRGYLRPGFRTKSKLLYFITELFGLKTNLSPSLSHFTFGKLIFLDDTFYLGEGENQVLNVTRFDRRFKRFLDWMQRTYPDYNLMNTEPFDDILGQMRKLLRWSTSNFSLFLFRELYLYYRAHGCTINGLVLEDIYFSQSPGWTDVLLTSTNVEISTTTIGFVKIDPAPRISDHDYIDMILMYSSTNCRPRVSTPETALILMRLEEFAKLPYDDQLRYITTLFQKPEQLISYGEQLSQLSLAN